MSQGSRPASLPAAVRAWLTQPELTRLWDKVHERLQRNGIAVHGHVLIADATHAEREALSLLIGRSYITARVKHRPGGPRRPAPGQRRRQRRH